MVTQTEIFALIRAKLDQRPGGIPRKAEVTKLMKQLYHPSLEGDRYFYSQDANDLPLARIPTDLSRRTIYCAIAPTNILDWSAWESEPRPEGYLGETWPPTSIGDLLGRPSPNEYCIGCNNDTAPCDCSYKDWSAEVRDFVTAKVALQDVPGKGIGGIARGRIEKESVVGEFTGVVRRRRAKELHGAEEYHTSIIIGGFNGEYEGHPTAWVDCARNGSVARFYNHSCEPNAKIWEYRCGMGHRIIVYQTLRVIEEGEEITVDYGDKWFVERGESCLCGSAACKNPLEESESL